MASDPNAPVTLVEARSTFEADVMVSVLAEAGIEAKAFTGVHQAFPLNSRFLRVPVQVRAADIQQAKAVLAQNKSDSVDLDWDEVDVGVREDTVPLSEPGRMPLAARIAFVAAVLMVLLGVAAVVLSILP